MNGVESCPYLKATLETTSAGHVASNIDSARPWALTTASHR